MYIGMRPTDLFEIEYYTLHTRTSAFAALREIIPLRPFIQEHQRLSVGQNNSCQSGQLELPLGMA